MTPTAGLLLDRFLADRERTVTPHTLGRDRQAVARFREFLDAGGPCVVDEFTGRRLARQQGGVGLSDLLDVDAVVMGTEGFLEGCHDDERRLTALVVRRFVIWLERVRELDPCATLSLLEITRRYAPPPAPTHRARHRPPGAHRTGR